MIISTIPDMFSEHYYFIKEVFPQLKEICSSHDIDLEYVDLYFSMTQKEFDTCRSIQKYFNSIDSDRTFYICFRGQKLGCVPTPADIDKMTLDEYPDLVDYIGDTSFTELTVMHALHPFEKCDEGDVQPLSPVKHSLFYFRNDDYIDGLSQSQKEIYTCKACDDEFVHDLKLAMAKDLVFHDKRELDKMKDNISNISIRRYDGIWDGDLELYYILKQYGEEYARLTGMSVDDLPDYYKNSPLSKLKGGFSDFKCDGSSLKDVIIEDFINELKLEFPQNFE
jgi:hypothetical protein